MDTLRDDTLPDGLESFAPLAYRMRPRALDDVVGQLHLTGENGLLRRILQTGILPSMIFWGPPGSGKTSTAMLLAESCQYAMISISAVASGVREIRECIQRAEENLQVHSRKTVFFIDEITENPSFEVIAPLLSRTQVILFRKILVMDIATLIRRSVGSSRGLNVPDLSIDEDSIQFIASLADGDARQALNELEIIYNVSKKEKKPISLSLLGDVFQKKSFLYDKTGEEHFNMLSAFHKSLRGSDPDAALYWMCRMLDAGEDPNTIFRRLVACASEDVGNADPRALLVAVAAQQAYDFLGEPEGRLSLSQAITYVASAPKSNASSSGLHLASSDVREFGSLPVPLHLRNAPTNLMKKIGYGKEYKYAHDYPGAFIEQEFRPPELEKHLYYRPTERGYEKMIGAWLRQLWKTKKY
ncbi:MAG: replication-associated recombination protein A [Candidatus Atribacteria bacterium]|nr:replication-associated recombination protein A [Candidatus Atribacteria bacterium]